MRVISRADSFSCSSLLRNHLLRLPRRIFFLSPGTAQTSYHGMLRTRPSCFGRSSIFASGEFREMQQRLILQKTLEECEQDDCDLNFSEAVEYEDEDSYNIEKDGVLLKHGLHTSLFHWLLHSMPGQSRQKLPSVVVNKIDNQSCWALAFCGFLWTSSTCMVFSLLPVFLKTELGYSNTRIGAMEGAALLISNLSRIISGVMSDIIKSRVKVIAFGSAMTAVMKLLLASAATPQSVMAAKLLDRFGKGVRAAPTDALIADLSPRHKRSTSYGLHQSLTTLGGVFGSMCAVACMTLTQNNYRLTFTFAAVPSFFAIFLLLYFVQKPNRLQTKHYGVPKYPARPAPSKHRHGRGPLAMIYEPVRWRRAKCKDKGRDMAWHRGRRTWRIVSEWLTEHLEDMTKRAQRVKDKRPGELLFPQLSRLNGENVEDWQKRQGEWEAEYLSTEEEKKYRRDRCFNIDNSSPSYGFFGFKHQKSLMPSPMYEVLPQNQRVRHHPYIRLSKSKTGADEDIETQAVRRQILTSNAGKYGGRRDPNRSDVAPKVINTDYMEKKVVWGSWRWSFSEAVQLPRTFWKALLVFTLLKVARFSEAFVTLHANAVGLSAAYLPMLMVATNLMQSLLTYPLGVVADRAENSAEENTGVQVQGNGRKFMLLGGFGMMILADLLLVMAKAPWQVFIGYLAVGAHMSMTQANMKAVLSATMPPSVRGTGFAISALTQGIALGAGNYMAGRLCDIFGSAGAFWGGGAFATAALGLGWLLL